LNATTDGGSQTTKEIIRAILDRLPDDATWDEILDEIYHEEKLEQDLRSAEEGDTFSQEEVEVIMARWRASGGLDPL
jgi:hypothetical protein